MKRLGLFAFTGLSGERPDDPHVLHLLRAVRPFLDRLIAVVPDGCGHDAIAAIADRVIAVPAGAVSADAAYRAGTLALGPDLAACDELLLFDSSSVGPLYPLAEMFDGMAGRICDFWSVTVFDPAAEKRILHRLPDGRFARWSFLTVRRRLLSSPAFREFWRSPARAVPAERLALAQEATFTAAMRGAGFTFAAYIDNPQLRSADPRLHEAPRLIAARCPLLPYELFTLDPLTQDAEALHSRQALEMIRERTDYDASLIWRGLLARQPLRDLQTSLDLVSVLPAIREADARTNWRLGRVAVLLHLYYPEMIGEFLPLFANLPVDFDLFVTTASEDSRRLIASRLTDFAPGKVEVRVLAQNRGRDMSALFVGLRDVVLSGGYEICLRLHSKRSPQLAAQIGDSFTEHMLQNLLPSRAHVANLFDLLEREPSIGLVVPPLVHIGLFTFGHSWVNNRNACERLAEQLGIAVPFDEHTPLAPYGSMFWFRCEALKPLFAHPWRWEDYNPEPHYIDGDLSHAQERLVAYVAQSQGYRTETVLSTQLAGRYYAKLEYKLQLLSSCLPEGKFARQYATARADMRRRNRVMSRPRLAKAVADASKRLRARHPELWEKTRPVAGRLWPWIKKLLNFH